MPSQEMQSPHRFLVLYGSQLGQAKALAESIADEAVKQNLVGQVQSMAEYNKGFNLLEEHCIVIVTSTTGDGDPPDNAAKMWMALKKKNLPNDYLKHVHYTILGLGDTNYNNFCNCGRSFNRRLLELGAKQFYPPAWADDGIGLELVVEPWLQGLWPALKQYFNGKANFIIDGSNDVDVLDGQAIVSNYEKGCSDIGSETCTNEKNVMNPVDEKTRVKDEESTLRNSEVAVASLQHSGSSLSETALNIPALPSCSLQVLFCPNEQLDLSSLEIQNSCPFPSANTNVISASISSASVLSQGNEVKTALELRLSLEPGKYDFMPGDSIGIICQNDDSEVKQLLTCLGLEDKADAVCVVSVSNKEKGNLPPHLLPRATLRHLLKTCCDIRSVPKKALLRMLAEYTTNLQEKRRLQELCSRQGSKDYNSFVRAPSLSILDLLISFPTCKPPVSCLLELLPRLQPRPYSIASSPLVSTDEIHIVFNVVEIPKQDGRQYHRRGVCTGWLSALVQSEIQDCRLEDKFGKLALNSDKPRINMFFRSTSNFRIPRDPFMPFIMIGAGTGVAPFIGFLQHKQAKQKEAIGIDFAESWLFYGCRYRDKDCLYRQELQNFQETETLNRLYMAYSRETGGTTQVKYVQDNISATSEEFVQQLLDKKAKLYVCGDAKNMAKDVFQAVVTAISTVKGITEVEARRIGAQLQIEKFYLQDVWT